MKIHEYQAKELLAAAGAAVPKGVVASSPQEALAAFDRLGGPVVLKAQVHAGGRGKGHFLGHADAKLGGVKFLTKREDVGRVAEVMFKHTLVTHQTGPEGQKVSKVLVVQASDKIAKDAATGRDREYYVGVVLDRAIGLPVLMGPRGGTASITSAWSSTGPSACLS
jgi:succinyl-CoA synthetase beta subunit